MTEKGKILKSASVIALATVISRICGYLRDQRVALLLGTSPAADSFILAFRIPNMIRRMTGEGALGASFIPVFTGLPARESRRQETWQFAQRAFWDLAVILAVVAVLGSAFSRQIVGILTVMGVSHVRWDLAIYLNRIIFPCVFFMGLAALAGAILQQLSSLRASGFHVDLVQPGIHRVFVRSRLPADYELGAAGLPDAGSRACGWHCGGRGVATGDADSGALEAGNALPSRTSLSPIRA